MGKFYQFDNKVEILCSFNQKLYLHLFLLTTDDFPSEKHCFSVVHITIAHSGIFPSIIFYIADQSIPGAIIFHMSVNNKCVNLRLSHLALLCTQNEEEDTIEENNTVYKSLLRRKYKWMKTGKGKNIHIYIKRDKTKSNFDKHSRESE